ncbi:MAG TPA: helix-turn-helix transcriptional regulator [Streptosporangiaceae bacterium]
MSPVFRHGKLRLYLLKLLDEAPRHGYEVIRLLQDRFMGIYAPSPGTIYPRLARLEEDGLVTHEEVNGKKIYSITDKGREEIRSRLGDLADLEDELTESLRDVAREISVDVRETVRTIREELASAAKGLRNADGRDDPRQTEPGAAEPDGASEDDRAEPRRIREEARRNREQMRASFRQGRRAADWPAWSAWSAWADADDEAGSASGPGFRGRAKAAGAGHGGSGHGGQGPFGDLERMAMQFASELRAAARQTGNLGDRSLNELRDILTDTLAKVRSEVFTDPEAKQESQPGQPSPGAPGDGDHD